MKYLKDIKIGDLAKYMVILVFQGIWIGLVILADAALDSYHWTLIGGISMYVILGIITNIICGIAIEAIKNYQISSRKDRA